MSTKHLSQLPQLFRSPFLRKVARGNYYNELVERLEFAGLSDFLKLRLSDIFEAVYEILLQSYRCEYVFKNTLMQNWFLSRHSTERSFITDEFRVGKCRVDLALFSKTSIAFEIKTEFDSPMRLPSQSTAYKRVFDLIYIVTTSAMLPKLKIPKSVGVLQLEKSGSFKTVRDSESHANQTGLLIAFNCLWQSERVSIVELNSKPIKNLPNSEIYGECLRKFRRLLPFEVQRHVVQQIRNRTYPEAVTALMSNVPNSLKHAALTLRATNQETNRINAELKTVPRKPTTKQTDDDEYIFSIPTREAERDACA
ncbi:MAG: sce7726 family protein [Verrucomicrobiota bacterium]|jgi:hypothetical protein